MERKSIHVRQKELEKMLNVTPMTLHLWRKKEVDPFPAVVTPRGEAGKRVRFDLDSVKCWLQRNRPNLELTNLLSG